MSRFYILEYDGDEGFNYEPPYVARLPKETFVDAIQFCQLLLWDYEVPVGVFDRKDRPDIAWADELEDPPDCQHVPPLAIGWRGSIYVLSEIADVLLEMMNS